MATLREAVVKILTEPPGIIAPSIAGVGQPVQVIEVEVLEVGGSVYRFVVVQAHYPQQSASVCEEIARNLRPHFPGADIYFTLIDRGGEAEVYVPAGQGRPSTFSVAAAVTVIKASWGWEEANPMHITVAGDSVGVRLERAGQSWVAFLASAA